MDIEKYFHRIGFTGQAQPTLAVLQDIHARHPQAIAFENLSSFIGAPVDIDTETVFGKLVGQGRGGYCFEQNRLLADVLRQIGFQVSEHAARVVWRSPDKTAVPRTHMLLKVSIDGEDWISDVGFGGLTMTAPLLLDPGRVQSSPHEDFMISRDGDDYVIAVKLKDAWKPMYVFDLTPQYAVDYEMANHYVSRHPQSIFVHNLMLGRVDADGRHALANRDYTHYSLDGEKHERRLDSADEFVGLLANAFNIRLEDEKALKALREKFQALP